MASSFRPATRAALVKCLTGYADPARVVRSLEGVVVAYDPVGTSKTIREMTRATARHVRRVAKDTDRLLRTLAAVDGLAGLELAFHYLEATRATRTPGTTAEIFQSLFESLVALRTAARKAIPRPKRGRPRDDLRTNLCEWVGIILAWAPASRARMVRERSGDVGAWRLDALRDVLPIVLKAMGAPPHRRDYPPLFKRAEAGLMDTLTGERVQRLERAVEQGEPNPEARPKRNYR